jgi:hypothetical protein
MKPHRQTTRQGNHRGLSAIPRGAQRIERSRGDKQNPKPTFDRLPKSKKIKIIHFKVTRGWMQSCKKIYNERPMTTTTIALERFWHKLNFFFCFAKIQN